MQILLERVRKQQGWPFRERALGFDEQLEQIRRRKFNAAYLPVTSDGRAGAAGKLSRDRFAIYQLLCFLGQSAARCAGSAVFAALENVDLSSSDIFDLSPLAVLKK